ncbi:hypothetical protein [Streptomyces sp. NPDC059575]|uniref:hypothetical protein n=1 Tax=Streptomyces sp. NPDC059575 TaxID=3346872 RepID=UPI0036AC9715
MSTSPARLPKEDFAKDASALIASLRASFLRDEDLEDDLDAVLGANAGPMGVAGARCQRARRRSLFRRRVRAAGEMPPPDNAVVHELGCSVTRLDRMLGQLVEIAKSRLGTPPRVDIGLVVMRADGLRSAQPYPVGEFTADLAHLRRLAMAASDLLDLLSDAEDGS